MADESWVGFARSPKPDKSLVKAHFALTIETQTELPELFRTATTAAGLSLWLMPVVKADLKVAGKIEMLDDHFGRAVFTAVELGRRVVINSEQFGEIEMLFAERKSNNELKLSFTKMVAADAHADFLRKAEQAANQLEFRLGE